MFQRMEAEWLHKALGILSADERYSRMLMPLVMLGCVIATITLNTARAVRKARLGTGKEPIL